jgi:hypothetical protein
MTEKLAYDLCAAMVGIFMAGVLVFTALYAFGVIK